MSNEETVSAISVEKEIRVVFFLEKYYGNP